MDRRSAGRIGAGWMAAAVALATVALAVAPLANSQAQNRAKNVAKGGRPVARKAGDPLAEKEKDKAKEKEKAEPGSFHYRLKLHTGHDVTLTASYYPGKLDTSTPVVLLIHEKERSHKDFEDPIAELKNEGLAFHLQSLGYAVFSFDLRGHGERAQAAHRARLERHAQRFASGLFILARSSQPGRVEFVEARGDRVGRGGEPGGEVGLSAGGRGVARGPRDRHRGSGLRVAAAGIRRDVVRDAHERRWLLGFRSTCWWASATGRRTTP